MPEKAIKIRCTAAATVPLDQLVAMQGALKKLSPENEAKLRKQIVETGFRAPIFVWKNGKENRVLDGHQRLVVLKNMAKEGYTVPPLPVAYVEADSEQDAYRAILQFASQYGQMTDDGLLSFLDLSGIDLGSLDADFRLPDVDFSKLTEPTPDFAPVDESEQGKLDEKKPITCPECGHEFTT